MSTRCGEEFSRRVTSTNKGRDGEQILTLHQESAQQLLCGHRFDFCSQVDVSPYHQGRSPETQDPAGHRTAGCDAEIRCKDKHLSTPGFILCP